MTLNWKKPWGTNDAPATVAKLVILGKRHPADIDRLPIQWRLLQSYLQQNLLEGYQP